MVTIPPKIQPAEAEALLAAMVIGWECAGQLRSMARRLQALPRLRAIAETFHRMADLADMSSEAATRRFSELNPSPERIATLCALRDIEAREEAARLRVAA